MKETNLRIIEIEDREEAQLTGPENIFNKIKEEKFPNLKTEMPIQTQEGHRLANRLEYIRKSLRNIIIKTANI